MTQRYISHTFLLLFIASSLAFSAPYKFEDIIVPGATYVTPRDINNNNVVVGTAGVYAFPVDGFTWTRAGGAQTFTVPGINLTFGTEAEAINDAGIVAGSVFPGCCSSTRSGFVRQPNGSITILPDIGFVRGINNAGYLAGSLGALGAIRSPMGGVSLFAGAAGADYTISEDINNAGVVVGYFGLGTTIQSFLRSSTGSISLLSVPGATITVATGINDLNQVVGYYRDPTSAFHGFLWQAGAGFQTFDHPNGAGETFLYGINNAGLLLGAHRPRGGLPQIGFLAVPETTQIPEPGGLLLVASGLLLVPALVAAKRANSRKRPC